jgi:hypothetical protein
MNTLDWIVLVIIVLLASRHLHYLWVYYTQSKYVKSVVDGQYYLVRDTSLAQESADTLAEINKRIKVLLKKLRTSPNPSSNTLQLLERYDEKSLMENITLENTTYTVNKGKRISVCLMSRDKTPKIYDINHLMFVVIHELAHIGSKSYGHTIEFTNFFVFLLLQCIKLDIYKFVNYKSNPIEYCGMIINNTPVTH